MQSTATLSSGDQAVVAAADASGSAVSWAAILAGAFTTAALTLLMIALGAGFGFSAISPWSTTAAGLAAVGVGAGIWLVVVQWLSAGVGGYVTGRLRTGWTGIHTDEVFFRDTAHGLLMWAVSVVVSTVLLTSAVSSLVGGAANAGGASLSAAGQGTAASRIGDPTGYFVDSLFRSDHPAADANSQATRTEATRIFASALASGDLPAADKTYLGQVVAARTGLTPADAEKRVGEVFDKAKNKAKEIADAARKSAAYVSFFLFLSWLVGAFVACVAAAFGGSQRDEFHATFKRV